MPDLMKLQQEFLTKVCEELFGCFMHRAYDEDQIPYFMCALCEIEIDIGNYNWADHGENCIIPKVRQHLIEHKPECVPPKKVKA